MIGQGRHVSLANQTNPFVYSQKLIQLHHWLLVHLRRPQLINHHKIITYKNHDVRMTKGVPWRLKLLNVSRVNDLMRSINSSVIPYNCSSSFWLLVAVVVADCDEDPFLLSRNHEYTFIFTVKQSVCRLGTFVNTTLSRWCSYFGG